MKLNGKSGWALLLIVIGAFLLLKWFIPVIGAVVGLIMPILILLLGFYGMHRGKKIIGLILVVIGGLMLMSKAAAYIGLILAGALIYLGISILFKNSKRKNSLV